MSANNLGHILFSSSSKKFPLAKYAVAKVGESPVDAVKRSIGRTTGYRVVSGGNTSRTENRKGEKTSETLNIILTTNKQLHGDGYGVVGEFRVTVHF